MGVRQPVRISPGHGYGSPEATAAGEYPRVPSAVLPLLLLFVGLAVATVWFVAIPAFNRAPHVERSCEVIVLKSGTTKCIREPTRASRAATNKPARHAKH
jgi:hypothetical protein